MGILGIDLSNPLQWDMASPDPKNKQDASVHYVLGVRGNIQAYLKNKIKNNGFNPITKTWLCKILLSSFSTPKLWHLIVKNEIDEVESDQAYI